MRIQTLVLLLAVLVLSGCAGHLREDQKSERQLYEEAQRSLDKQRYLTAIERLQLLESRFPFGEYGEQAQLELIYAYYGSSKFEEARAAAKRFIRLNYDHPQLDYVIYLSGLSAWAAGRHSLEGLKLTDISQRDPGATREAYTDFQHLIKTYPNSIYTPDAQQRLRYLKNWLAIQEVYIGRFYLRRGAPLAAINRGLTVVEGYRDTPAVADALAVMAEGYLHLDDQPQAQKLIAQLYQINPKHPQLKGKNKLQQLYPANEPDKTIWQILSFDLL